MQHIMTGNGYSKKQMKMGNGSLLVMDIRREKTEKKCILITNSEQAVIECEGIEIDVVPAWKWLLEE